MQIIFVGKIVIVKVVPITMIKIKKEL